MSERTPSSTPESEQSLDRAAIEARIGKLILAKLTDEQISKYGELLERGAEDEAREAVESHVAAKQAADERSASYMNANEALKNAREAANAKIAQAATPEATPAETDETSTEDDPAPTGRAGIGARVTMFFARRRAAAEERHKKRAERREGETDEAYASRLEKDRKKAKIVATIGGIALGGAFLASRGQLLDHMGDAWDTVTPWDTDNEVAQNQAAADQEVAAAEAEAEVEANERQSFIDSFIYDPNTDPANHSNKDFPNDFGSALGINPDTDTHFAGYGDWVDNRLKNNPAEFAAFMAEANMPGAPHPSNIDAVNALGDKYLANPEEYAGAYEQFMAGINDPETTFETKAITTPYESWYITEDGNVHYDNYVDHGGTVTVITFKDGTVLNLRNDCGQPIELLPEPVYTPQGSGPAPTQNFVPQGSGPAPVEYTPEQPTYYPSQPEQPTYTPPTGSGPPPTPVNPPTPTPPTPEVPPVTPPPVEPPPVTPPSLDAKIPTQDINVNPDLPEQIQMGDDRMDSGPLQGADEVTIPEPVYEAPVITAPVDIPAPEADTSSLWGTGNTEPQQSGISTGGSGGSGSRPSTESSPAVTGGSVEE